MKKRHQQKLVVLSLTLFFLINIPLVFVFNESGQVLGFPKLYFFLFACWAIAILISAIVLNKYYE
ncbi:hypothetical protein HN014_20685 [Aquimarina sp. TRL1]|nr:hypothetical protein HN014_20685 [Aquimarina sp. TRL1]